MGRTGSAVVQLPSYYFHLNLRPKITNITAPAKINSPKTDDEAIN